MAGPDTPAQNIVKWLWDLRDMEPFAPWPRPGLWGEGDGTMDRRSETKRYSRCE
jgi:hypothetical protein